MVLSSKIKLHKTEDDTLHSPTVATAKDLQNSNSEHVLQHTAATVLTGGLQLQFLSIFAIATYKAHIKIEMKNCYIHYVHMWMVCSIVIPPFAFY